MKQFTPTPIKEQEQTVYFYLYKFFETAEYRKCFLDGMLYCNTAKYLRECEQKYDGVRDDFENAEIISIADDNHFIQHRLVTMPDGNVRVFFDEYEEKPKNYKENQMFASFHTNKLNLFCMSAIYLNSESEIIRFDKANINNFGEYGVFIYNVPSFMKLIGDSLQYNPSISNVKGGFVQYVDYEKRRSVQNWDILKKFSFYKAQQEFRFVFENNEDTILQYKLSQPLNNLVKIIDNKSEFFSNSIGSRIKFNTSDNK